MKAVAKTSAESGLEIIDAERPKIQPGEVLLQVAACGICGSDLHLYDWDEVWPVPARQAHRPAADHRP